MTKPASDQTSSTAQFARLAAPGFVTFTDVTPDGADELEFVISNEATGKFFAANRPTVQFFSILKEVGSVPLALAKAGIPPQQGENLIKRLVQSGLLVRNGETQSEADLKRAPIESKLVSLRWDLIDASRITHTFGWLGRLLYSPIGYLAWFGVMIAMIQSLLSNTEKLGLGLRQIFDADWRQFAIFAVLYVGLKAVHEMGHALAFRTMCLQEGVSPGPIRMGISIFAFTPFPFTDVTGAWRLRSVFRRIMIGAGGIYFETWIIALLAIFWAQTQSGLLQTIILQVAVFAGVLALLFNLNPAIKLDGYYMLTDYLRRPNLFGRASLAARNVVARSLGAKTPPIQFSDFAYWVLSYTYRWTIFAGIFWLIYQFDKRLAPVAVGVIFMMLIARPLFNTMKYAFKLGIRPLRTFFALGALTALAVLFLAPFPDRILLPGQMRSYETRFVEATEAGYLRLVGNKSFELENPGIEQRITDIGLRREMLETVSRSSQNSAAEQASIVSEIESLSKTGQELQLQLAAAQFEANDIGIWTPLSAEQFNGAWVTPAAANALGAYSQPISPYLELRLDQSLLERDIALSDGTSLQVRSAHDPSCEFPAKLTGKTANNFAVDGMLTLRATPTVNSSCLTDLSHGGAVVARLATKSRSLLERIQFSGIRLLQNRLEINSQRAP